MEPHNILNILIYLTTNALVIVSSNFIFFTSPGGNDYRPGFYGGQIVEKPQTREDIVKYGFHCIDDDNFDLNLEALAYDPITNKVLLYIRNDNGNGFSLYRGDTCVVRQECTNETSNGLEPLFQNVYIQEKIYSVAYYDGNIYFVMMKKAKITNSEWKSTIELREFENCTDGSTYPFTSSSSYQIEECSRRIAIIGEERYSVYQGAKPERGLQVIQLDGGQLKFFTLVTNVTYNDAQTPERMLTALYSVLEGDLPKRITEEVVDMGYNTFDIHHTGGVSVKGNTICWTTYDRILCGHISERDAVSQQRTVLREGQAAEICRVPSSNLLLNKIVTGVAILHTSTKDTDLQLYFGCVVDIPNYGGFGFITVPNDNTKTIEISSAMPNDTEIYAGSMFVTEVCEVPGSTSGSTTLLVFSVKFVIMLIMCIMV